MKLSGRIIGIAVGAFAGALALALVLFFVFFPTELAAREAEQRIERATGRDLTLGRVRVSFWPALGFSAEQAALSNPAGFAADAPFIAADRIVFAVALAPLLRGDIEVKRLIFQGAELNLVAAADGRGNWDFPTEADAEREGATLEDLRLDDVRLTDGTISFQGAGGERPLVLEDVDARVELESLDRPAELTAAFDYLDRRVALEGALGAPRAVLERGETPISVQARSEALTASFEGSFDAATGVLAGRIDASGDSLRRLMAWIGAPMAEGGGFGAFALEAAMRREGERTAFADLVLRMDEVEARGQLALVRQQDGRLGVEGALAADALDLNPYLPAPAQGESGAGVEVDAAWSRESFDLSGLNALDANVAFTLGRLRFHKLTFTDLALVLRLADGAADARLTRFAFYGGAGAARLIADGSGPVPRIAVQLEAQNIQAQELLRDAIGFENVVGRGRLAASLVGAGASQAALMRSLDGDASFTFNDGEWRGVNLASIARTVQSALTGETQSGGGATDFAELGASFTVADGVAATDDLRLLNPFVRLQGRGLIDIGAQTIDMRLEPRAVRSAEGQGGDADAAGLGVPFRASGPWSNVSFRPALEDMLQEQVRGVLSRGGDNPLTRLGETLFGRTPPATESQTPAPSETPPESQAPGEENQPRNPLEDLFRRATQPRDAQAPPG